MIKVIPTILTSDTAELKKLLARCESAKVDRVQIDIIDGVFADNKTIDLSALPDTDIDLDFDFHLMVKEPVNWVEKCVDAAARLRDAPARQADRIIGQVEMMSSQIDFVGKVTEVGAKVGLAINLATPVSALDPVILNNLDVVLVMSVSAGLGGQKFDARVLDKIEKLDRIRVRDDTPFRICDDGGITLENIDDVRRELADEVSIGRRLFKGNLADNIRRYKLAAYKHPI